MCFFDPLTELDMPAEHPTVALRRDRGLFPSLEHAAAGILKLSLRVASMRRSHTHRRGDQRRGSLGLGSELVALGRVLHETPERLLGPIAGCPERQRDAQGQKTRQAERFRDCRDHALVCSKARAGFGFASDTPAVAVVRGFRARAPTMFGDAYVCAVRISEQAFEVPNTVCCRPPGSTL